MENPSILALAVRSFGPDCPPLVCTSGWPNSAAIHLLLWPNTVPPWSRNRWLASCWRT
ncbi:DUF2399 domain-containing protein [Streptomyces prasinus]